MTTFAGSSPTREGKLVADAHYQQTFEPGEWGLRVVLSGHFCASLNVGHARSIKPVFDYRITCASRDQNKLTNNISVFRFWRVLCYPPNTDTDNFYGVNNDIDAEAKYPKFCTEILKNTSIFQYKK